MSSEEIIYQKATSMSQGETHYCPGCTHGTVHKLIAECLDEINMVDDAIVIAPVGCAVLIYDYFQIDGVEAAHGRAPAVATGVKRVHPDKMVISYQGDGDLLAIGMAETIHAANRGENITVIFVNNAIYGMTGGQMAPTTMVGQKTTTTPSGRQPDDVGLPIRACELLNTLERPVYIERVSCHNSPNILKAKKAIKKALLNQKEGKGYSFVEVLATCPTNWGLSPKKSYDWLEETMIPYYPLGNFRDKEV
ncbi:2-oxoglutarate oxidoreductase [Thiospirochaeta perfilievii]|uniref:2-oxoglutarate oxidoreductase n=1 Tax=Thiospirochaeta perfilievii TaxID=252967 RepID=A0A5C1QGT9_9SPIO|nr:thiamine pyrophosphate-dependent enzyme [Thiospirochaeta perfilievii]QEN05834.1 2-oxoglutarate oxidoreductase [Thiospirochaeta perfilievii]